MLLFLLRVVMRTAHVVAAGVWVGGSVTYLLVLLPAYRAAGASPELSARSAALFRRLVNLCIGVLLVSGVYLVFDRLASAGTGVAYVVVLAVKVAAALGMIGLALVQAQEARRPAARRGKLWKVAPLWILWLGLITTLLGATLTSVFESGSAF